jgi:hypothetical protein
MLIYAPHAAGQRPLAYVAPGEAIPDRFPDPLDLALDIDLLRGLAVDGARLEALRNQGAARIFVWVRAGTRPPRAEFESWQEMGFDGALLADFDADPQPMIACPARMMAGIVYLPYFAEVPHRIAAAARILRENYGRDDLLFVLDAVPSANCPDLTHARTPAEPT